MTAGTRAFRQFVLKVHSRCDLACDHCYVYEHADQSWRHRPRVMPDEVVSAVVSRIAEHARAHPELPCVHVILHGGEPLLAGPERLADIARRLRGALDGVCELDLGMQTNGLRLDEAVCRMLVEERISTGISLDGDRDSNDRHRKRPNGTGSYDAVVRAVRLLGSPAHRSAFAGLLCTIDVANDPRAVYDALAALDPPRIDFLLPHTTWDRPPPPGAAHARWLTTVYDRWSADGRPFPVRLFDSVEAGLDAQESFTEALGLGSPDLVVVETDGEIEQADWLKTTKHGAPRTGFHVLHHTFDEAAGHPGFLAQSGGLEALSRQCRDCSVVRICGGGLYGHRYRSDNGFDNPSVYCADLFQLIGHVRRSVRPKPAAPSHTLTVHGFDSLAAGDGDGEALRVVVDAEASRRRILLAAVCARCPGPEASAVTRLDQQHPAETAAVLGHPHLGTWAVRALDGQVPHDAVRQRLGEVALATALRTGGRFRLNLSESAPHAHLPGTGRLTLPPSHGPVALVAHDEELVIALGPSGRPRPVREAAADLGIGWQPVRRVTTGEFSLLLEDGDPYRDGFATEPLPQLTEPQYADWIRLFAEAATHLRTRYAHRMPGVRALLAACTPLHGAGNQGGVSTDPHAFGALGLALPDTASALAALIVEGVQQVKFNALADLFDLADTDVARESLRSAYLGRRQGREIPHDGLTSHGRRMAARLRG
ncbi:FxsB family cyclophane-forming radical SAM/SPASM peptide maturase [Streptomyces justiciae]|uniref:FxsB family cyclophane-forming radical SAM/SPASM peptide maturase n=1 Tax=Streptomyces justiciae TaxID=2780140 RepID=A0ABU3LRQ8_9ACTN|nr:FxsB family cyclophane-forming radical SAM/SPASM peptide maturase [Streptomyces justiciae]MDT7841905.1 FxsB family cyclophane-forming radical SAM/SPASM peptide maturase [Streptomyces justiciae]